MITLGCRWMNPGHFQLGIGLRWKDELSVAIYIGLVVVYVSYR